MNYSHICICAMLNVGAIVVLAAADLQPKQAAHQQVQQTSALLKSEAQIRAAQAEQARAIADAHSSNAIAQVPELILDGYVKGQPMPAIDWQTLVNPSQKTLVFDQYRNCLGYSFAGGFFPIQQYPQACKVQP